MRSCRFAVQFPIGSIFIFLYPCQSVLLLVHSGRYSFGKVFATNKHYFIRQFTRHIVSSSAYLKSGDGIGKDQLESVVRFMLSKN